MMLPLKTYFTYISPYKKAIALGLTIKFFGTIMDLCLPWILSYMIDDVVPLKNIRLIVFWGVMMLLCAIAAVTTNIIANRMASKVARDSTERIRYDLFLKSLSLSARKTDEFSIPSLVSRLTTDTYNVHHMTGMMQRLGVRAPILLLGSVCITLIMEPVLALIMVAALPLVAAILIIVSKKGIPLYTMQQQATDELVRTVRENYSGIRVIKALSRTEYEKSRFDTTNDQLVQREKKAGITMAAMSPAMNIVLYGALTFIVLAGAVRVQLGLSQVGKIVAFTSYFTIISNSLMMINRMFTNFSKGCASARRICQVLDCSDEMTLASPDIRATENHIEFENVSFSYDGQLPAVTDISFGLKKGQTLGIIGKTGCGKSTLMSLLMRFYDPDSGIIRINGQSVNSIDHQTLSSMFGVVFQNDFLMSGPISENIAFGRDISTEDIENAAVSARAMEFISGLEEGFVAQLTAKGSNFSGGQKQRMLIARALAGTPEILILDDSSSALDYKTDAELRREIAAHRGQMTTIIIAQRVSSISSADLILVMDEGRVIGSGTHSQLLDSCATYAEINEIQMGEALVS